jgi:GMP synthase-like glutamine amidotransferase
MKPILIFRHIECEGPGYFAQVLRQLNLPYKIVAVDQGQAIPKSLNNASALVFMGGPMSVNDADPWIQDELRLVRAAVDAGMPLLGHCLGGQLISKAMGGEITFNPVREIGWHKVDKIANTESQRWLAGIKFPIELYHWHGETFALPPGVTPLLQSAFCRNQAWALRNILALQCHVEMELDMVNEWASLYAKEIAEPSLSIQSREQMNENLETRIRDAQRVADALYTEWLKRGDFIKD